MSDTHTHSQWYRDSDAQCPFVLSGKITFKKFATSAFRSVTAFPWSKESINVLWDGRQELSSERWDDMVLTYADAIATATDSTVMICFFQTKKRFIEFILPPSLHKCSTPVPSDSVHLAWVLSPLLPYEPLLVVTRLQTIYILKIGKSEPYACLIGHGGAITSIVVHPTHPHVFATTSRDFTARIYDMTLPPLQGGENPVTIPEDYPSAAGLAFGLNSNEKEGVGMGRCVIVLTGGRSGGHNAAVLGAAFHPTKPLIATCGMDRAVKIWALPLTIESPQIVRQDKPLFSTTKIHRGRVLSINWLSDDILLSHDSPTVSRFPAVLRPSEEEKGVYTPEAGEVKGVYTPEAGEVMMWRWLSLNRFFPPELQRYQQTVRPSQGDWDESRSYQILFQKLVPCAEELSLLITPTLSMYTLHPHCPVSGRAIIMIYPESTLFHLLRVPDAFKHRLPPKYPFHHPSAEDTDTGSVPAGSTIGREALTASDGNSEGATIPSWLINIEENSIPKINACAMPHKGNIIVGVGTQGTLWTWTIK